MRFTGAGIAADIASSIGNHIVAGSPVRGSIAVT
jgi:hypothetical protein